jgi:phospholipid/cholesterol/gamma-HCH transport system ATP-binding protein
LRPDAGEIWVDGVEVGRLRGRALDRHRARFGVLFQGGALFDSLTVFENVAFPLREKTRLGAAEIRRKVDEKLAQLGLSDAGAKYPAELSGGMRKRVALARALITEPDILLFDEPTTGLDPIRVSTVHRMILDMQHLFHFTAVVVSHEIPEVFDIATRVAMLHGGVIVAEGTPEEIRRSADPVVRQFVTGSTEGPIETN